MWQRKSTKNELTAVQRALGKGGVKQQVGQFKLGQILESKNFKRSKMTLHLTLQCYRLLISDFETNMKNGPSS